MNKIPTLFQRNPVNRKYVLDKITPGCEWVVNGEGIATRKYDGTCCMFDGKHWWARREVKPGKDIPDNYQTIEKDEATGKIVGWEPMNQSGFARWHSEAISLISDYCHRMDIGTYELCGPKINGNPEKYDNHVLICHNDADEIPLVKVNKYKTEITYQLIKEAMISLSKIGWEGIVWHHSDGRMAKIKARDFNFNE